jgi:hypothetical protein
MPLSGSAFWAVILPVEKTNLLRNPSLEQSTTDWVSQTGNAARSSDAQTFGAFCYQVPTLSGGTLDMVAGPWTAGVGTAYTASIYVRAEAGKSVRLGIRTTNNYASGAWQGSTTITTGGTWHRHSLAYTEASGGARYVIAYIEEAGQLTAPLSVDGAMVEVGSLTTYIDGNQDGCYWTGQPHLSPSVRSGTYRGGGSVVALEDLGLKPDQQLGIGMPPLETTAQSFALTDGAEFQRQRARERPFTLTCKPLVGTSLRDYHVVRRTLIDALKVDLVSPQQPARLWYTGGQGTVSIDAVLDAGLEGGEMTGPIAENLGVRFIAHDPFWYATTDQGTQLASSVNLGSTNFAAYRDPLGRWGTMGVAGTSLDAQVFAVGINPGGTVFYGGQFGTAGGTRAPIVAMYLPSTGRWGTLTGGTIGGGVAVQAFAFAPSGTMFVGGVWDTIGGTTAPHVGQWNGAWGTLGAGTLNNQVLALEYSATGTLFAGGVFTQAGGTQAPRIAMWLGPRWGTLVGGTVNSTVYTVVSDARGTVYAGGDFTEAGGTAGARFLALWNSAWGTFTGGTTNTRVYNLAFGPSGLLYVGGVFLTANGGTTGPIVAWNRQSFTTVGGGLGTSSGSAQVNRILPLANGGLLASGLFNRSNGRIAINDNFAQFTSSAWLTTDIDVGAASFPIYGMAQDAGGTVYIGGGFSGTALAASVAQLYNTGRTDAAPICAMRNTGAGTARVYQLLNTSTGDGIYFDLVLLPGEEVTLDLTAASRTLLSSARGNLFSAMIPGSNLASWRLTPGTNYVSFFADSASLITSLSWRPRHWSADGGTAL